MMNVKASKILVLSLLLVLVLILGAGCGNSVKDKYIGTWSDPDQFKLVISTNDGKTFGLKIINPKGKIITDEAAILKEGYLEVNPFERLVINPDGKLSFRSSIWTKN
jgi:hypothetical protein